MITKAIFFLAYVGLLIPMIRVVTSDPYISLSLLSFAVIGMMAAVFGLERAYRRIYRPEAVIGRWERRLGKQIARHTNMVATLKASYEKLSTELKNGENFQIGQPVKKAIDESLVLWQNRVVAHQDVISHCQTKLALLATHKEEVRLLRYTIRLMKKDPYSLYEVQKLETMLHQLNGRINKKVIQQIDGWITRVSGAKQQQELKDAKDLVALVKADKTSKVRWYRRVIRWVKSNWKIFKKPYGRY